MRAPAGLTLRRLTDLAAKTAEVAATVTIGAFELVKGLVYRSLERRRRKLARDAPKR